MASSDFLTPAMLRLLRLMHEAETADRLDDAELVCEGARCWVGEVCTTKATANRLLRLTLISESSFGSGTQVFTLNSTGRAVLRRPALASELEAALLSSKPFTIGADDRIAGLSAAPTGPTVPAMLAGSHRKGSGQVVHAIPGPFDWNYYGRALCGAKPGPRSAGWAPLVHLDVSCQRCLAKRDAAG